MLRNYRRSNTAPLPSLALRFKMNTQGQECTASCAINFNKIGHAHSGSDCKWTEARYLSIGDRAKKWLDVMRAPLCPVKVGKGQLKWNRVVLEKTGERSSVSI